MKMNKNENKDKIRQIENNKAREKLKINKKVKKERKKERKKDSQKMGEGSM